jgi:hypothetical protein
MSKFHVFANDVVETMIARDEEDAVKVWEETVGEKYDFEENGKFEKLDDDEIYTLYEEKTIEPQPIPNGAIILSSDDFSHTYRATCRAWAEARGRCYLGSTEY